MSTSQQLYKLQELEAEIELIRQNLRDLLAHLGESPEIVNLRSEITKGQNQLHEWQKRLHTLETDTQDLTEKMKATEDDLYSGRIKNPKELANLQHDIEILKTKRSKLDDEQLILMENIESLRDKLANLGTRLKEKESIWQTEQKKLELEIEKSKAELAKKEQEHQKLVTTLDNQTVLLYNELKKKRKTAVARVVQGICSGCRLQLPVTDLQRVRSGNIVQCSSCGRILYLA